MNTNLWSSNQITDWRGALEAYVSVIMQQGSERLPEHDRWYREELPQVIAGRKPHHATHEELVRVTEWKMARGVWRGRNLALVRGNAPELVVELSREAFAAVPHPTSPLTILSQLSGVGPATASAVVAAVNPESYPFFDEIVGAQIPDLGNLAFTLGYYKRYAEALRERAARLGSGWTPVMIERALWSNVGGKAGSAGG